MKSICKSFIFYSLSFVIIISLNGFVNYRNVLFESEKKIFQNHGVRYELTYLDDELDLDETLATLNLFSLDITSSLNPGSGIIAFSGQESFRNYILNLSDIRVHKSITME